MQPKILDHVAFWVTERELIVDFLERHLGMHRIAEESNFTLVGTDARRGKLTLFDAEGPREQGAFGHVALRVTDLAAARAALPVGTPDVFEVGADGVRLTLVEAPTEVEYDLDHVVLRTADPLATALEYEQYGFEPAGAGRVEVGGAYLEFQSATPGVPERPLLNHLAVLVDRAAPAQEAGFEVADVVDAENTFAVFVWGPDRVKLEYVEHKASFSLR